jgi:hypothetical protein
MTCKDGLIRCQIAHFAYINPKSACLLQPLVRQVLRRQTYIVIGGIHVSKVRASSMHYPGYTIRLFPVTDIINEISPVFGSVLYNVSTYPCLLRLGRHARYAGARIF